MYFVQASDGACTILAASTSAGCAWRRKESFREEVEEFIEKFNRVQIDKSADYFNDIFKSKKK